MKTPSERISERIAELGDWRGKTLARMRKLIKQADPDVVEEWKWMGTPVWSHDGILCTGESYKSVVKLTFAKGASLRDPARLFNSSLDGKGAPRDLDIRQGEEVDASAFKALVRQAIAHNGGTMASQMQLRAAARRNIRKAAGAAKRKRTVFANLPKKYAYGVGQRGRQGGEAQASRTQVKVIISGGFSAPYRQLLPEFESSTGIAVTTLSGASQGKGPETIAAQLARGVAADVVILSREGLPS